MFWVDLAIKSYKIGIENYSIENIKAKTFLPSVIDTASHFLHSNLVESACKDVNSVPVVCSTCSQTFIMPSGFLHVRCVVCLNVMMGSDDVLQLMINNHTRALYNNILIFIYSNVKKQDRCPPFRWIIFYIDGLLKKQSKLLKRITIFWKASLHQIVKNNLIM